MIQGINKEYIFDTNEFIEKFLDIFNKNKVNYNFTTISYCIMNNHAHFLIYVEDIKEVEKFMHRCNLLYAQLYNKENQRVGVLFRNRYQAEPIYDRKYLINCIKYIHDNPVKAKMVEKCEDYKYSSYCDYKFNREITQTKIMKEIFGDNCNYLKLFKENSDMRFIDIIGEDRKYLREYILEGIRAFKKENHKSITEILSNRDDFKKLIFYLNDVCKIKFVEIKDFFSIPRGTMDSLKKR